LELRRRYVPGEAFELAGMGGRFPPESVADLHRNHRPISIGMGGRFESEWVAGFIRNMHKPLERVNRERERRLRVVDSFSDRASVICLTRAVLLEVDEE